MALVFLRWTQTQAPKFPFLVSWMSSVLFTEWRKPWPEHNCLTYILRQSWCISYWDSPSTCRPCPIDFSESQVFDVGDSVDKCGLRCTDTLVAMCCCTQAFSYHFLSTHFLMCSRCCVKPFTHISFFSFYNDPVNLIRINSHCFQDERLIWQRAPSKWGG